MYRGFAEEKLGQTDAIMQDTSLCFGASDLLLPVRHYRQNGA